MASSTDQVDPRLAMHHMKERSPDRKRVLRVAAVLIAGATLLGGATLLLIISSPVLLFFSPILVPLAIVAGLAIGGLVSTGVFVSSVAWVYKYVKGRHPVGSHQVDAVKNRIVGKAHNVSDFLHSKVDG